MPTNTGTTTQQPAPLAPPEGGDLVGLLVMGLFFALLLGLGVAFVRKKGRENRDALAAKLDKPTTSDGEPAQLTGGEPPLDVPVAAAREPVVARPAAAPTAPESREAYRRGLEKTRTGFFSRLTSLLAGKGELDPAITEEVETLLIQADVGVKTAGRLLQRIGDRLAKKDLTSADKVRQALKEEILAVVNLPAPNLETRKENPCVVMVVGVNGAGKTTTMGKLANRLKALGHGVVLGAGDTFRAAAVEQLKVWGDRAGCVTVEGKEGSDSASVLFEAVKRARDDGAAYMLGDTAGRLHTKVNLMEELKKVHRVLGKAFEGAPHEVLLVVDATMGQNAVAQAEQFNQDLALTGIVLTKLDGTAKGGVVIAICDQLKLPIRYVGVGEKLEDLRVFEPAEFVDALFLE